MTFSFTASIALLVFAFDFLSGYITPPQLDPPPEPTPTPNKGRLIRELLEKSVPIDTFCLWIPIGPDIPTESHVGKIGDIIWKHHIVPKIEALQRAGASIKDENVYMAVFQLDIMESVNRTHYYQLRINIFVIVPNPKEPPGPQAGHRAALNPEGDSFLFI